MRGRVARTCPKLPPVIRPRSVNAPFARVLRIALPILLVLACGFAGSSWAARTAPRFDTVVIDAGHGGDDAGALGRSGLAEKDLVLGLAKQLRAELARGGLRVVMTRVDDTFVSLEERFAIANDARGDLFVSIHANASLDPTAHGSEVYYYASVASDEDAGRLASRENAALRASALNASVAADPVLAILGDMKRGAYDEESARFARLAEVGLARMSSNTTRGVKQAPFVVLSGQMPASLVEVGFLTHSGEEKRMRSKSGQKQIVAALKGAVLEYGRSFNKKWETR